MSAPAYNLIAPGEWETEGGGSGECPSVQFDSVHKAVFRKKRIAHVGRKAWEQGIAHTHVLVELVEGLQFPWWDLHHGCRNHLVMVESNLREPERLLPLQNNVESACPHHGTTHGTTRATAGLWI